MAKNNYLFDVCRIVQEFLEVANVRYVVMFAACSFLFCETGRSGDQIMHCDESISSFVVVVVVIILHTIIEFNIGVQGQDRVHHSQLSFRLLIFAFRSECYKCVIQRICHSVNSQKIYIPYLIVYDYVIHEHLNFIHSFCYMSNVWQ